MVRLLTIYFLLLHLAGSGQILNGSFENWSFNPDADINQQQWTLNDWRHESPLGDSLLSIVGTYRDTIAQSGDFALGLSRWYNYTFDVAAFRNASQIKPSLLAGYYKFVEGHLSNGLTDTAQVAVYLTKYDPATQTTDTIGAGILDLPGVNSFTLFHCPIVYTQPNMFPDSVMVIVQPTKFRYGVGGCEIDPWCSFLTVDDLTLSLGTSAHETPGAMTFSIFPNPSTDRVMVSGQIAGERIRVFNVLGKAVFENQATSDLLVMDVSGFKSGVYFVAIAGKAEALVIK